MMMNEEIYGKQVRDEIVTLYKNILADQAFFDQLRFHSGGIECLRGLVSSKIRIPLKQTELDYIRIRFPQDSIYTWKLFVIYEQGDDIHFGKTFCFDKINE